jgi:hypothetical protein
MFCRNTRRTRRGRDAAEFDASHRRTERDVVRIIGRQPRLADLACNAETSEDFHRPRRNVIAPDAGWFFVIAKFNDEDIDPAPREIHSKRQSDRARPSDQHRSLVDGAPHGSPTWVADVQMRTLSA